MALNARILSITAGGLLALAFIFYVVSNAVPEWSKVGESKIGLWRFCEQIENLGYECGDIICKGSACSKLYSARAFVILACIMSAISALLLFACAAISDNTRRILLMAGKGLAFVSLIMGIIGVALGINFCTEAISETKLNWGASAIIGIIAIVVNFCGAITSVLIK